MKAGSIRTVMNLAWKRQDCFWYNTWNKGFTKNMYYGVVEKLITGVFECKLGRKKKTPVKHYCITAFCLVA